MVSDSKKTTLKGNYTYIGLDIDTTGRRLIDEVRKKNCNEHKDITNFFSSTDCEHFSLHA